MRCRGTVEADAAVQGAQRSGCPPVPSAEQPHGRRYQQGSNQRGVHHDRRLPACDHSSATEERPASGRHRTERHEVRRVREGAAGKATVRGIGGHLLAQPGAGAGDGDVLSGSTSLVRQKGYLSTPSQPVRFITGTPHNSTCAVSYYLATGWASGFVANITITDTGPNPITGWTLAFSFPAATESVSGSYWNANVAQNGQNVVVTPVDWNANLAPNAGNTVSFGFVGNQTGANPPPDSFTLNGTVCTTTYSS